MQTIPIESQCTRELLWRMSPPVPSAALPSDGLTKMRDNQMFRSFEPHGGAIVHDSTYF